MSRKPRIDGKLFQLEDADQLQVFQWIKTLGYTKAKLLIKEKLSVETSLGAMHNFWEHWSKQESENRILKAVTASKSIMESVAGNMPLLDSGLEAAIKQSAFEAALTGDADGLSKLVNTMLRIQSLDFRKEQFAQSVKSSSEKALDVLFDEIKGNAEAEQYFNMMREAVLKAIDTVE